VYRREINETVLFPRSAEFLSALFSIFFSSPSRPGNRYDALRDAAVRTRTRRLRAYYISIDFFCRRVVSNNRLHTNTTTIGGVSTLENG